jgi:hypothetical protein
MSGIGVIKNLNLNSRKYMLEDIKQFYVHAVRTVLLARHNSTKNLYHIFSVIELQPDEIPKSFLPRPDWHDGKVCRSKLSAHNNEYSFSLVVHEMSVEDALNAFDDIRSGKEIDGHPIQYFNSEFIKEPNGDYPLVIECDKFHNDGLAAVLPKRESGVLVWSKLDSMRLVEKKFRTEEISNSMKQMSQLTTDWLGFDIWSVFEHIGNIYLSAVNPYYRSLDVSLDSAAPGIHYHFYYRKGIQEPLKLRIIDRHGDYIALDKLYDIENGFGSLKTPHELNNTELRIYNSHGQLVATQGPFGFIESIAFGMQVKQADVQLVINDTKGTRRIDTEKYSPVSQVNVGTPLNFNPAYYFKSAVEKRKHIALEENKEFIFLPGAKTELEKTTTKEKARKLMKVIIDRTQSTCYLCDPYFSAEDLINYAFTAKNSAVKINIINRRGKEFVGPEKAAILSNVITDWNKQGFQQVECKMLTQDLLHDRFIIADRNVWYIGSSFNEIGNRASCIAKVPGSADTNIVREIESWFFSNTLTQTIDAYLGEQSNA